MKKRNNRLLETILSQDEAAFKLTDITKALGTSRQTIRYWITSGKLKANKLKEGKTNSYWIKSSDLKEYLQNRKTGKFKSLKEILKDYELPAQRDE